MITDIQSQIDELEYKRVLAEAELRGLEERKRSLEAYLVSESKTAQFSFALATDAQSGQEGEIPATHLTLQDAVLRVVLGSTAALRIEDVLERLQAAGRVDRRDSTSVTLANLAAAGKIRRLARGVYGKP